ncbi:hypothetical protein [Paenibacillus illinoisensis]|nr:hypothetical protein [Paenibacillus illinoisensis]
MEQLILRDKLYRIWWNVEKGILFTSGLSAISPSSMFGNSGIAMSA